MKLFHSFRREGRSPSRRDFLFGRVPAPTAGWKIAAFLWSAAIWAAVCFALGHLALYYGTGDYRTAMYESYFEIEMLPLLNILPIFWLGGLLWFLLGRAGWAAALTAVITMGFTMANVLKMSVRNVYFEAGLDPSENLADGYETPYLFWANDVARGVLGRDMTGEGPTLSPCFLMNELFDQLGWEGPAYMQYTDTVRERLPVLHTSGLYLVDGALTDTLSAEGRAMLDEFRCVQYYYRHNFQ